LEKERNMSDYETRQKIDSIERDVRDIKSMLEEMQERLTRIDRAATGH